MTIAPSSVHVRRSWKAMLRDEGEAEAFARVWAMGSENIGAPLTVHPKAFDGVPLLVRPGTTDAQVLDDTFVGLYHLPPTDLTPDAVILDLGGNVGYTAAHYAVMAPRGRIICVEMDAGNAAMARENLQTFGVRCTVVHAAAWDEDGELAYSGTEEWGFRVASLDGETTTPAGEQRVRVRAARIETILRDCGVEHLDLAKIDIEGAEERIVRTEAPWLRCVRTVKLEYHPPATRESMTVALAEAGFQVRDDERHPRALIAVK